LGTGSVSGGGSTLSSFVKASGVSRALLRTNLHVTVTQAGTHSGRSFYTRITADDGAGNLTLAHAVPWVGA